MANTENDKRNIRKLAEEHFGHHAYLTGVRPADVILNERLLSVGDELPADLTLNRLRAIFAGKNLKASDAYLRKFYSEYGTEKLSRMHYAARFNTPLDCLKFSDIARRLREKFEGREVGEQPPPTVMNIQ
jgi:hypothetical protein